MPDTISTEPRFAYPRDRKSTRLNSSHRCISYAVFCLKKKKTMDLLTNQMYAQLKLQLQTRRKLPMLKHRMHYTSRNTLIQFGQTLNLFCYHASIHGRQ